jgi:parallel beta-helix repeat protein
MKKINTCIYVGVLGILLVLPLVATQALLSSSTVISSFGTIFTEQGQDFDFVIYQNGGVNYVRDVESDVVVYSGSNVVSAFNAAFGRLPPTGGNIVVQAGTYTLDRELKVSNRNNVYLAFEEGAVLYVGNNVNAPAFTLENGDNWVISNIEINGNAANQGNPSNIPDGLVIYIGENNRIEGADIHNVRRDGIAIYDGGASGLARNNVVIDSKLSYCGWNGLTLGGGEYTTSNYILNNDVAHCGDVGITVYSPANIIEDNYVHDMDGTTGYNDAHWGIAVEGLGQNSITNNTVLRCSIGVVTEPDNHSGFSTGSLNVITNNHVEDCQKGFHIADDGYNTISNNTIIDWSGICIGLYSSNNVVDGNTLIMTGAGYSTAGVQINSGCDSNTISNNDFTECPAPKIQNSGVNTQIFGNIGYP